MTYAKLTVKELKSICKDNHLKNCSALNKKELIAFIKKNKKIKNKKKIGGFNGIINRRTLKELLNITEDELINLQELDLNNNNIITIESGTFDGLKNLQQLNLNNNQITTLKSGSFNGLTKLERFDIFNNPITTIESGAFTGLTNLQQLNLIYNPITTIESGAFTGLTKLQVLDLSNNQITSINDGTFNGLSNLQELNLNNNKIKTIVNGSFTGLTNLQQLNLYKNKITTFVDGAFNGLTNLQQLKLTYNQIITIVDDSFSGLTNLQVLDLTYNQITIIKSGAFNGLTNLQELYLIYNQITTIDNRTFNGLTNLQKLYLNDTHLDNESRNYCSSFLSSLKNNTVIKNNMLKTNNNDKNDNHKLYNHILTIDDTNLKNKPFTFEGADGINEGGLTRTVYDIFYNSYIKKFFLLNNNGFYILQNIKNNNKDHFRNATEKLILLAKKGKVKIVIPIHETLFEILESENITNTININNIKKYNNINVLTNETRKSKLGNRNSKLNNVILINNNNKKFNINFKNINNNDTKKEVFLRRYLNSVGFKNEQQFECMYLWSNKYWDHNIFTQILSFTKKDFIERIIIITLQDGNNPRQEYKLSSNNNSSMSINKIINNNTHGSLIQKYPNLKVILKYINQEDDECRKKFNKYMTGSIYDIRKLKLILENITESNRPIHVHTCSRILDIFKINPNESLKNHTTLTNNRFEKEFINSNNSYISN